MGIKLGRGVCLAYMALGYVRDALPKETLHRSRTQALCMEPRALCSSLGLVLAGIHVAAERRRSTIVRMSKPAKLASIAPAIAGLFMVVTWWQLPRSSLIAVAGATPEGAAATELQWESNESAAAARAPPNTSPCSSTSVLAGAERAKNSIKNFPGPSREGGRSAVRGASRGRHQRRQSRGDSCTRKVRCVGRPTGGSPLWKRRQRGGPLYGVRSTGPVRRRACKRSLTAAARRWGTADGRLHSAGD